MTAVLSAQPPFPAHLQMPECPDEAWRSQYTHQLSVSVNNWEHPQVHADDQDYDEPCYSHSAPLYFSRPGYFPELNATPDMDNGTPSTVSFSNDGPDHFRLAKAAEAHRSLAIPMQHDPGSGSAYSPNSSIGAMSPLHPPYAHSPDLAYRPDTAISGSSSARSSDRLGVTSAPKAPAIKRNAADDDDADDDELSAPGDEPKSRGRKRQRIPHTAVERRYRENLNAHLNRLRQTVPWLASERPAAGSDARRLGGDPVKPSKCEILNGAIEHIGALGKENANLRSEVKALRARLDDLEAWYHAYGQRVMFGT